MSKFYVEDKDALLAAGRALGARGIAAAEALNNAESFSIVDEGIYRGSGPKRFSRMYITDLKVDGKDVILFHSDFDFLSLSF